MILAIIGDIHSNTVNLKKAIKIIEKRLINQIIVVGDLQNPDICDIIGSTKLEKFSIVLGNADFDRNAFEERANKYSNIEIFGRTGEITLGGKKIAFCHFGEDARRLGSSGKYDIVFWGHIHSPWEEKMGKTLVIRPGEIAGEIYEPSFCIFDTETMKAELILLNR